MMTANTNLPTVQEFETMCQEHDWTFHFSDSLTVWRAGNFVQKRLEAMVAEGGHSYKAVYLKHHVLPWSEEDVLNAYSDLRVRYDELKGESEACRAWEASKTLDPLYAPLPRHKRGWWWIAELSKEVARLEGREVPRYAHII